MTGLIAVPVYNEAGNLQSVIDELCDRFPGDHILFIDDGSSDESHRIVERAGLPLLRHPINLGYEEALRTAMHRVIDSGLDYVVFFDGDGQHRVEDLESIIRCYESERYDLIVSSRYQGSKNIPLTMRSFATRLFSKLTTLLAGVPITDVTNGLKLISRRFIPVALKLPTEDMHAELIVGLARCGARIHEIKTSVRPRATGESMYHLYKTVFYPAKTSLCLLAELIFYRRLRAELSPPRTPDPTEDNSR